MARDLQRQRCYNWENQYIQFPSLYHDDVKWNVKASNNQQMVDIYNKIMNLFGLQNHELIFDHRSNLHRSTSQYFEEKIVMCQHHHDSVQILLHEIAHTIVSRIKTTMKLKQLIKIQGHGAEWVTIYMILLSRVLGVPISYMIDTANDSKLKFYPELVRKYGNHQDIRHSV